MTVVATYFVLATIMYKVFSTDLFVPCLWKTIFHFECPGCGLTTAFLHLLSFDFPGAWHANALIFVVLPAGLFYLIKDFIRTTTSG